MQRQPRSASLNPDIYPSWWGEDDEIERLEQRGQSLNNRKNPGDTLE